MHLAVLFAKEKSSSSEDDEEINIQILRSLCQKEPSMLQSQDVHGYTPLHLAFRLDKKPVLDVLFGFLKWDFKLTDRVDEDGLSFLHIAAAKNNIPLLIQMLESGSKVNAIFRGKTLISRMLNPGSTALHFAVTNGSSDAAKILLSQGADIYAKDGNDMTPIHLLLYNPKVADLLLNGPNLRDSVVSDVGLSHLHVACWYGHTGAVSGLLHGGASINGVITCKEDSSGFSFLKKYTGFSPLLFTYQKGSTDTTQLLLQRDADIFVENTKGKALLYSVLDRIGNKNADSIVDTLVIIVKENDDERTRLKADTGMTDLHIACLANDDETVAKLISEGADVNKQIRSDSPIFQGYTPLHIILYMSKLYDVENVIELLVKKGADVTLPNAASQTGIHMAYEMFDNVSGEIYSFINMMLDAQRDYSLNPVSVSGLTHFHVACNVYNTRVVEKFLNHADIDINQSIDYFQEYDAGCTALHLAAGNLGNACKFSKQLDTIDLLLRHGADVEIEDTYGDTPIFNCFQMNYVDSESLDVFERIARAGADVNARNLNGHTPLNYYLDSGKVITLEGLKTLLRTGCCLNTFNTVTNHGYIAKVLSKHSIPDEELSKLFYVLTTTFRQEIATDNLDRTAIHNIVSGDQSEVAASVYASCIDQLSKIGINVDDRDSLGRTALHLAANFHNSDGIAGLLMAGADINVCDLNGKTAFAYDVGTCGLCRTNGESTGQSENRKCVHIRTLQTFAIYIKKLQLCGLDVNKQNEDLASKTFEKFEDENLLNEDIFKELEIVKNATIGSQLLNLSEFLSETGAVAKYPRMSLIKRDAINKFFSPYEIQSLREKFPELAGILQLQYRKARARPRLTELAGNALAVLAGFRLPHICSDCIFVSMTNSELMNLAESTINVANAK